MNKVYVERVKKESEPSVGCIFEDDNGTYYILCNWRSEWIAVSLVDGYFWQMPSTDVNYAIVGLTLVADQAEIIIRVESEVE